MQSSPVQEMMAAGNPNWWCINNMTPPPSTQHPTFVTPPYLFPQYTPPSPSSFLWGDDNHEQLPAVPVSLSQLLSDGLMSESDKEKCQMSNILRTKKGLENWEEQLFRSPPDGCLGDVSLQQSTKKYMYGHENEEYERVPKPSWSPVMPVSPPTSCVTSLNSNNLVEFSGRKSDGKRCPPDRSSECNSSGATGGSIKKARTQPYTTQTALKVRKEKVGDRITALHQLVSPFGKTDTASVLLESIGYIRFLHNQIEALSLPYLGNKLGNVRHQQQHQNDYCEEPKNGLRGRGLCLVPISCTLQVGSDNRPDCWAPAFGRGSSDGGSGGFR